MSVIHPRDVSPPTKSPNFVPIVFALPFDIECAILDQLSDDFGALQACSLVCHGWRSITQRHLFRSVCVNLERRTAPSRRVRGKSCLNPKVLRRFLDFLDGSPDVASFVLNVRVRGGWGFLPSFGGFIPAVLSKAPRLRTLALSSLSLGVSPQPLGLSSFSLGRRNVSKIPSVEPPAQGDGPFPRAAIDTLDISRCRFYGLKHLFDILRHFSRIRQLNVYRSEEQSSTQSLAVLDDLRPSTVPVIESVMLDFPVLYFLLPALRTSSLPNGALKAIRCSASEDVLQDFLVPCLEGASDHLRELHLDVDSCRILTAELFLLHFWNELRPCLASCSALESITVAIDGKRGDHRVNTSYVDALRAVFSTYARLVCPPPPSVRSIAFRVRESFGTDAVEDAVDAIASGEHWGWLDGVVCEHRPLAHFSFVFENADGDGDMAEEDRAQITGTLEGLLPNLRAKGVLGVELTAPENPRWVYPT